VPTYEYACRGCGQHLEVVQSFKDDALTECPSCEGELRKVFSAAGIIFKGSGWHVKDYAASAKGSGSSSKSDEGPSSGSSAGGDGAASGSSSGSSTGSTGSDSGGSDSGGSSTGSGSSSKSSSKADGGASAKSA
jgi:putative FmdB family regulatory protein